MKLLLIIHSFAMFLLSKAIWIPPRDRYDNRKGIPDAISLKLKISRGSGTGVIPFGFIVVVLLAFALFVVVMALIVFYKRDKGIRSTEKTIFLTPY